MGPAASPQPTLDRLRRDLAALDPSLAPRLPSSERQVRLADSVDAVLGGGLSCGAVHEMAAAGIFDVAAASGFALAVASRASETRGEVLWITTDFAVAEGGGPYGPGLDLFGLAAARLLVLRVPRPLDALWAMEEALRCRALACVVAELPGNGVAADLTATRRLALAAREGAGVQTSGFGLLIRHRSTAMPSAAATRWTVAAASSRPDPLSVSGEIGRARFDLTLCKNRRGPCGRWTIEWDHHERIFRSTLPVVVAAPAVERSDRTPLVRAG